MESSENQCSFGVARVGLGRAVRGACSIGLERSTKLCGVACVAKLVTKCAVGTGVGALIG